MFSGFNDRDTSFKFIKRLWASNSNYAPDDYSDEDDEDDTAADLLSQAREEANKEKAQQPAPATQKDP